MQDLFEIYKLQVSVQTHVGLPQGVRGQPEREQQHHQHQLKQLQVQVQGEIKQQQHQQ